MPVEAPSVAVVQKHVDDVLGNSSVNTCYEVDSSRIRATAARLRESVVVAG